jgi:type IV pilus assembly protein PilC
MATFQYDAIHIGTKSRVNGILNAATEKELREQLREQELIPTKIKQINASNASLRKGNFLKDLISRFTGVSSREKIIFTRNMGMMVKSGIPITEGLLYFETYAKNQQFRSVISQIRKEIIKGKSFSDGLALFPKLFNEVFINVIRAGETSGELDVTLGRLTTLMVKADKLKAKIVTAAVYPCMVLFILSVVMLIMFVLVLPTFEDIYKKMNVELPFITIVLLAISKALKGYWFISFPAIGVGYFTFFKYITSEAGKRMLDYLFLRLPIVKDVVLLSNNSSYLASFRVGFAAGVPIIECLSLASRTIGNHIVRRAYQHVTEQIQGGQRLAQALSQTGHMQDLVLLMLSSGEESGSLESMLESSCDFIDEELNNTVDKLTAMMEPVMLMVLGLIVGTVALGIYMPMFSMYDHL